MSHSQRTQILGSLILTKFAKPCITINLIYKTRKGSVMRFLDGFFSIKSLPQVSLFKENHGQITHHSARCLLNCSIKSTPTLTKAHQRINKITWFIINHNIIKLINRLDYYLTQSSRFCASTFKLNDEFLWPLISSKTRTPKLNTSAFTDR